MYQVTDKDGKVINSGDTVYNHRGEAYTLETVSRPPMPGKSAKWIITEPCDCLIRGECDGWNWGHENGVFRSELYVAHGYTVTDI